MAALKDTSAFRAYRGSRLASESARLNRSQVGSSRGACKPQKRNRTSASATFWTTNRTATAKLSSNWYEFDIGWLYVRVLRKCGLLRLRTAADAAP